MHTHCLVGVILVAPGSSFERTCCVPCSRAGDYASTPTSIGSTNTNFPILGVGEIRSIISRCESHTDAQELKGGVRDVITQFVGRLA